MVYKEIKNKLMMCIIYTLNIVSFFLSRETRTSVKIDYLISTPKGSNIYMLHRTDEFFVITLCPAFIMTGEFFSF